jgi:hypothetical protein
MVCDGVVCEIGNAASVSNVIKIDAEVSDLSVVNCRADAEANNVNNAPLLGITSDATVEGATVTNNHVRGDDRSTATSGMVIESGATLNGQIRFSENSFKNVTYPYDDGNGNGSFGETLGVTINGRGVEAVGATGSPTAAEWSVGDIVRNSSDGSIWQLRQDGSTWDQLS